MKSLTRATARVFKRHGDVCFVAARAAQRVEEANCGHGGVPPRLIIGPDHAGRVFSSDHQICPDKFYSPGFMTQITLFELSCAQ